MVKRIRKLHYTSLEMIFLLIWTFYSAFSFLTGSELGLTYDFGNLMEYVGNATIICLVAALFLVRRYSAHKICQYALLLTLIFLIEITITSRIFLIYVLFIILGQQIDFDKFIRYDIVLKFILFVFIVGLCLAGVTDNYATIFYGTTLKQSFGFQHPNTFTCYILVMLVEYLYIRFDKIKWYDWCSVLAIWLAVMKLGGGRTSGYTFIAVLLLFFIAKYLPAVFYTKVSKVLFAIVTPLMAILSYVFSWLYGQGNPMAIAVNSVFTSRLSLGWTFLETYGVTLFGQEIETISTRQSQRLNVSSMILDNSYIRCGIVWGGVFLVLFICAYSVLLYKLVRNKRLELALLGLFFVVIGLGESYFINPLYNLSLFCLLGVTSKEMSERIKLRPRSNRMIRNSN